VATAMANGDYDALNASTQYHASRNTNYTVSQKTKTPYSCR